MQKLFRSLIALGGLAGLVACGDDVSVTEPPPPPLTISGAPVTAISVGAKVQLSASEAATWASSAANVASVDGTGLVTAVAAGTASITATATADVNRKASVTITVTAPVVRNVTVAPPSVVLAPGGTQQFVANIDADPGANRTVAWTSSNPAAGSINATTGVFTAVAAVTSQQSATVTATVGGISGSAAVVVRPPVPATISIQNITVTGTPGNTANANNIAGSIDVNLNVDPGEQVVQRVEVLIDGVVAGTQTLSSAQVEALRIAGAFEDVEAAIVSVQINTAEFSSTTGIAKFANGNHTMSARAIIAGGSQTATPSMPLTFNNASGVTVVVSNDNGTDAASAINPGTGLSWIGGAISLQVVGVSYVAGTTVASVNGCTLFGKTNNFPLTNGTATIAWTETSTAWTAGNTQVGGYLSPAAESIVCTGATLSNGQPMAAPSGSVLLNYGSPANPLATGNAAMPPLQVLRLDNSGPGVASANAVAQTAITMGAMTGVWVNAATTFGAGQLGVPTTTALNNSDIGVDNVTATVNIGATLTGANTSCNLTGLTARTAASGLAETIVSTAYVGRVAFKDALGNTSCQDLAPGGVTSATFGADFTPPSNVTLTFSDGNTNDFFYSAVSPAVSYILASTGDNASGISATTPGLVSISRDNSVAPLVSCLVGSGTLPACNQVAAPGTANITGGSAGEGYYNLTAQMTDVAGNIAPATAFKARYLVDATLPTFTGNVGMNAQYSGNAPAAFTNLLANDNLDLNKLFGVVQYTGAGVNIEYPSQSIGSFGLPLEKTFSGTYTIPSLIRCINPANAFAANAANEAQQITFTATDQANNVGTVAPVAGALLAALDNCGAVGNQPAPSVINSFNDSTVVYPGTGKTQVSKSGLTTGVNAPTANLTVIADVSLDNSPEPFTRVEFYRQNAAGNFVLIGTSGPGFLNQTVTNRTWTYKFVWDPDATITNGANTIIAIGIDAQGDAVRSAGVVVTVAN